MRLTIALLLALMAAACGVPTAPTARNVDGTPRKAGDPLQPWIVTNVQTGDNRIQHSPKP